MTTVDRPRIGLTCGYSFALAATQLGLDYSGGVEEAGGLPLVISVPYRLRQGPVGEGGLFARSYAAEVVRAVDGLILSGGPDLDPEYLGEDPLPNLGRVDQPRDTLEMALARAALALDLPVLGICRGMQVLAVAAGGGLYQDLSSQRPGVLKHHQDAARDATTHFVDVTPGTLLARLLRVGPVKVNSFHHQAISRSPAGFATSATAPDGVIEAIEATPPAAVAASGERGASEVWQVGVQWHPENLWAREPLFLNLFIGLVEAAGRYRNQRVVAP